MEKVCKKLWEVELKLDELKDAFVGSEFSQDEAREYASLFADLETSFSKIIVFIAKKKRHYSPTGSFNGGGCDENSSLGTARSEKGFCRGIYVLDDEAKAKKE